MRSWCEIPSFVYIRRSQENFIQKSVKGLLLNNRTYTQKAHKLFNFHSLIQKILEIDY